MAASIYGKGREAFAAALIDWVNDDIRVALVDLGLYTLQIDTHTFLSDIGAGIVARSTALQNKTNLLGVLDADDIVVAGVSGPTIEAVAIYKFNANDAAARLICFVSSGSGFPLTPNNGAVTVQFSNAATRILKL